MYGGIQVVLSETHLRGRLHFLFINLHPLLEASAIAPVMEELIGIPFQFLQILEAVADFLLWPRQQLRKKSAQWIAHIVHIWLKIQEQHLQCLEMIAVLAHLALENLVLFWVSYKLGKS